MCYSHIAPRKVSEVHVQGSSEYSNPNFTITDLDTLVSSDAISRTRRADHRGTARCLNVTCRIRLDGFYVAHTSHSLEGRSFVVNR